MSTILCGHNKRQSKGHHHLPAVNTVTRWSKQGPPPCSLAGVRLTGGVHSTQSSVTECAEKQAYSRTPSLLPADFDPSVEHNHPPLYKLATYVG